MPKRVEGLYAITPDLTDTARLLQLVLEVVPHVQWLQYRNKSGNADLRREQADALAKICRYYNIGFIINDDVDLALEVAADGVHLGRGDGELMLARQRLGPQAVIGASCYQHLLLAREAVLAGASYIAFGAVFPSTTKPDAARAALTLFAQARDLGVPMVAIGGITPANAAAVLRAGADAIAVIGSLFDSDKPGQVAQQLALLCQQHNID
ncbi:thiamine phosphate synthase [Neisseriaceae bacterium TC5R-5]|nr:thiamine phosphate synthase [Neisseriaceae bacterium TC5R-5]